MQKVTVIDSHTAGEPTRIVIAGGPDVGAGPLDQRRDRFQREWDRFRSAVVNEPSGSDVVVGALLVGRFEGREFVFAGKVGTGFDTKLLLDLRARLNALEIPKSPFTIATGLPRLRAHWTRPEIVVRVAFIEWTVHRKLRHSRLLAVFP